MKLLTRNPVPMQNSKLDLKWYLTGLVFILLAYLSEGFDRESGENVKKNPLFKVSSCKMPKVKNYFLNKIYFIVIQK